MNWVFGLIVAVVFAVVAWNIWPMLTRGEGRYYNCSLAEIHPDYPPAVREQCRKLNKS
jgi:hypothetical protein